MSPWLAAGLAPLAVPAGWAGLAWWLDAWGRRPLPAGPWDAVVVAGARVLADGRPSGALHRRVARGVELHRQGLAPRLVLTGGAEPGRPPEAAVAARLCRDAGVPDEALVVEDRSRTTLENAAFAARLVSGRIVVVTDSWHAFRCQRMFAPHFDEVAVAATWHPDPSHRARGALREAAAVVRHGLAGRLSAG